MLDRRFLDQPLSSLQSVDLSKDPRFLQAVDLAERGSYADAAALAQTLLDEGSHDIRILAHYLLGWFLQGGVTTLTTVVRRVHTLIAGELDALTPAARKNKVVDGAVNWLFRVIAEHCGFHATRKDDTWNTWVQSLDPDAVTEIAAACAELRATMATVDESPQSQGQIARLERWLKETLDPAVRRQRRAAAAADTARAAEPAAHDMAAGDAPPSTPAEPRPDIEPAAVAGGDDPSPAMQTLLRKLNAFARLVEQHDMMKAAVVANDIREIISHFDPLLYLPKIFSGYVRLFSDSIDELVPYWQDSDNPAWQALEQFYRTDLDGFLGRSSR